MYTKGKTRVSMVPERNTSRLEGVGMLSVRSKVTEKGLRLMNGDEHLECRETILPLSAPQQ